METPVDPVRIPSITLSQEEIDEIKAGMADGKLPRDFLDKHREAVARNVYGHDAVKDRHGNFIEQGIGAKGHETANHFTSLKKAEAMGIELPGTYDKAVADLWKRDPKRAEALHLPTGP